MELLGLLVLIFGLNLVATGMKISRDIPTTLEARSTWTFLGCYRDNVSGRALPHGKAVPGGTNAMTNALCESTCLQAGFSIAGTEYAGECWCGDEIVNGGGLAPDGSVGCNMPCKGSHAETCGGPNRLDVYSYSPAISPVSTQTIATSSSTHLSSTSVAVQPTTISSRTGKRGIAYSTGNTDGNATYANLFKDYSKVTWGYDWGYPSHGLDFSFEFVPMLWGLPSGSDPWWMSTVENTVPEYILGFNEPDLTYSGSSNILPANAAKGYQTYMEPFSGNVKIGLPNVLWNNKGSSSGGDYDSAVWTEYFIGNCTSCHFDFAAIHYYQDCNPSDGESGAVWFQGNVTNAYNTLQLPVWVTEFQCYGTDAQQIEFLKEVLPWMDSQDYVARYAYFGAFPKYLVNSDGTGLSDIGVAYASISANDWEVHWRAGSSWFKDGFYFTVFIFGDENRALQDWFDGEALTFWMS